TPDATIPSASRRCAIWSTLTSAPRARCWPCRSLPHWAARNNPDCRFAHTLDASYLQQWRCVISGRCGSTLVIQGVWRNTEKVTSKPSGLDPAVTERIGEFLRARGLRRMASRIQVLAVLEPVNGHLSVAEIHQRLTARLPAGRQPPDLATIYRTVT